ncbi:hypothetical protein P152DRAFT_169880 [Eremomyces bilateralis CBS 781.70]|uniref:C3H1-type domain-containing protein n=1 Tax=Eremomyces bilateralis CBS 781.70 TaxID=1392243 RepID=A0A6G1FTS0_9PEZI|nr:uncharacterized protein P152DRAFT_169880 [Eremomyces bilateralis CBS 781.70]KAF1809116.1 hypothetical protein P152DRAFT_169880 [Eremomyces bilateralis CBS 781.70]
MATPKPSDQSVEDWRRQETKSTSRVDNSAGVYFRGQKRKASPGHTSPPTRPSRLDSFMEDHNGRKILPKYLDPPLTCYYWHTRGRCSKSDKKCAYAHYNTGFYAPDPTGCYSDKYAAITKSLHKAGPKPSHPDVPYPAPELAEVPDCKCSFREYVHRAQEIENYNRGRDIELRAREAQVKEKEAQLQQREKLVNERERDLYSLCSMVKKELLGHRVSVSPMPTSTFNGDTDGQGS